MRWAIEPIIILNSLERIKMNKFKSEEEAIAWVKTITPFAIKPTKVSKTKFVTPFTSVNACKIVTEIIGKEIYKLLTS